MMMLRLLRIHNSHILKIMRSKGYDVSYVSRSTMNIVGKDILYWYKILLSSVFNDSIYSSDNNRKITIGNTEIDYNRVPRLIMNNIRIIYDRDSFKLVVDDHKKYKGIKVSDIALVLEYGNPDTKPRPIFRSVFSKFEKNIDGLILNSIKSLTTGSGYV